MSLVVSDTSPLNLLAQLGHVDVLYALFGRVVLPPEVAAELAHAKTPSLTRAVIANPPRWLSIQSPTTLQSLPGLDAGEVAAISLAVEFAVPILIDERDGRAAAGGLGVTVIGGVGVLEQAADAGLIADLAAVHTAIRGLRFHVSDAILRASLARHLVRRAGQNTIP